MLISSRPRFPVEKPKLLIDDLLALLRDRLQPVMAHLIPVVWPKCFVVGLDRHRCYIAPITKCFFSHFVRVCLRNPDRYSTLRAQNFSMHCRLGTADRQPAAVCTYCQLNLPFGTYSQVMLQKRLGHPKLMR